MLAISTSAPSGLRCPCVTRLGAASPSEQEISKHPPSKRRTQSFLFSSKAMSQAGTEVMKRSITRAAFPAKEYSSDSLSVSPPSYSNRLTKLDSPGLPYAAAISIDSEHSAPSSLKTTSAAFMFWPATWPAPSTIGRLCPKEEAQKES